MSTTPGPEAAATRKGAASRLRILAAAVALSRSAGLGALSFGGVAQAAGFSKSAILKHFPSREDLQAATIEALGQEFRRVVLTPAEGRCGLDRLRRLFSGLLDGLRDGCPLSAASLSAGGLPDALLGRIAKAQGDLRRIFQDTVQDARRLGEIGPVDAEQASFELTGAGLAYRQAIQAGGSDPALARAWMAFERAVAPQRRGGP